MNPYLQMLEMVSRTFTLSIKQLPRIVRDSIALAYLLLRVSDCLEDHESMEVDRKIRLLELWDQILEGHKPATDLVEQLTDLDSTDPEVYVAQKATDLMAFLKTFPMDLQKSIVSRVGRTTLGMARWQKQGAIRGNRSRDG